jgi:hypothetical protein
MVNNLQFLRSLTAGNSPVSLAAGQIAFNLADQKLFVGDGSSVITRLDGTTEPVVAGDGYFESDLSGVSANAYTDQKIAELIDSAPDLLNTLNELAAALGDDPNFVTTVTNSIATIQSNLDAEAARATAAEGVLTSDLATEVARAQAAEGVLTTDLATEVARAQAAEAAEEARALAAEGVLQGSIDSEAAARAAADIVLQSNLDTVEAAGIAAISAETTRATAAETALDSRITDIENGIDLGTF